MRGRLYVLLEGDIDRDFFYSVLYKLLIPKYRYVHTLMYSEECEDETEKFIKTAETGTCIFIHDFDSAICKTRKKTEISEKWNIALDKVHLVTEEIESWYLAGLSQKTSESFAIENSFKKTDGFNKSYFLGLKPKKISKTVFYQTILEDFDLRLARRRNDSFKRFLEKYID
jgi:hypothetical protein